MKVKAEIRGIDKQFEDITLTLSAVGGIGLTFSLGCLFRFCKGCIKKNFFSKNALCLYSSMSHITSTPSSRPLPHQQIPKNEFPLISFDVFDTDQTYVKSLYSGRPQTNTLEETTFCADNTLSKLLHHHNISPSNTSSSKCHRVKRLRSSPKKKRPSTTRSCKSRLSFSPSRKKNTL